MQKIYNYQINIFIAIALLVQHYDSDPIYSSHRFRQRKLWISKRNRRERVPSEGELWKGISITWIDLQECFYCYYSHDCCYFIGCLMPFISLIIILIIDITWIIVFFPFHGHISRDSRSLHQKTRWNRRPLWPRSYWSGNPILNVISLQIRSALSTLIQKSLLLSEE